MQPRKSTLLLTLLLCAALCGCGAGTGAASTSPARSGAERSAPAAEPAEIPDPPDQGGEGVWTYQVVHGRQETSYMFQDVMICVPARWAGRYALQQDGPDSVTFFHKEARRQLEGSRKKQNGGVLFTVRATPSRAEARQAGQFRLGDTERLFYYLTFPDQLQRTLSAKAAPDWQELYDELDYVCRHSWVTNIDGA